MLERQSFAVFFMCRIFGVVLRPLTLLVALNLPDGQFARDYALLLTALVSSFVIYGNQNHRAVYSYFLGDTAPRKGLGGTRSILQYLDGVGIHIFLFAPLVGCIVWLWTESLFLWTLIMPLVMIEKYYDDHQRALIYKRQYLDWSTHFLFRTILPSGALLAMVLIWDVGSVTVYTTMCLAFFGIYFFAVSSKFTGVLRLWSIKLISDGWSGIKRRARIYLSDYISEYLGAQIFSILAINILVVDRYFVKSDFPDDFARYVFAVNVFALLPLIHNIFHFTRIRPKLMDIDLAVMPAVFNLRNLLPPLFCAGLVLIALPILTDSGWIKNPLSNNALYWLAGTYYISAVSLIAQELVFWRTRREAIVAVYLTLFIAIIGILNMASPDLEMIPMWVALIFVLRLIALIGLSISTHPRLRLPSAHAK